MDPRVVFTIALKSLATSIIVAHNHPSGNLKPSDSDRDITKKLKSAGSLLDIQLLDHLIITKDGYTSFADEGWI
jgi:DNA repair protein RadC